MQHSPSRAASSRAAFTLVEMAIVITIIGLIIGGVLAGQSLLNNSKLDAVMTDLRKYKAAVVQFRQQYGGYPGDIADATDYWGSDSNCPYSGSDSTPKTVTCNGDGNGSIGIHTNEESRAWQQLADAGLITGSYSGFYSASYNYDWMVAGKNAPAGPHEGSAYVLYWLPTVLAGYNWAVYDGNMGTLLYYGAMQTNSLPQGPILTSAEASAIDRKVDDGKPGTGVIQTDRGIGNGFYCTTDQNEADGATAAYNTSATGKICDIFYQIDW